ncbi:MAG: hypothetical protein ACM3OC_03465 [Deltaproteobacteria bacterium]
MKLKLFVTPAMLEDLEERLNGVITEAEEHRARQIEISCGAISDEMRRRIVNYLNKKDVRARYSRYEKTSSGWNRIIIHFRWE